MLRTELGRKSWTLTAAVGTALAVFSVVAYELMRPGELPGHVLPSVIGWCAGQWGLYVTRRKHIGEPSDE